MQNDENKTEAIEHDWGEGESSLNLNMLGNI